MTERTEEELAALERACGDFAAAVFAHEFAGRLRPQRRRRRPGAASFLWLVPVAVVIAAVVPR